MVKYTTYGEPLITKVKSLIFRHQEARQACDIEMTTIIDATVWKTNIIVTDKLKSYDVALREPSISGQDTNGKWINNTRAENSDLPFGDGFGFV